MTMNNEMSILSEVEIHFPLSMVKEALHHLEDNDKTVFQSTCFLPTLQQGTNFIASKSDSHLRIHVGRLCFFYRDGTHECILNSLGSEKLGTGAEKETQTCISNDNDDIGTNACPNAKINSVVHNIQGQQICMKETEYAHETTQPAKRKRGRPRKSERQKKMEGPQNKINSPVQEECASEKEQVATSESADQNDSNVGRRYGLRGKKLNLRMMAVEKGSEWSGEEDNSDGDEDFSPGQDHDSDYDISKKSNTQKAVRKRLKENFGDSKENVDQNHSQKRIKDEINAILNERMQKNTEVSCKICNKVFGHSSKLFYHVEKQHSSCEDVTQYLKELNDLKMLVCDVCSEMFDDPINLQKHLMDKHQMKIDLKCPRCDFVAKNLPSLKIHVRNMHLEVGVKKAFCHLCPASFRSHGSLKQHIDLNHLGNKHVECDTCHKKFYNRSQLKRHSRIHGSDISKRFLCTVCNKSFLFEYNLKRHLKAVHQTQSESFHCSYCGKGFSQKTPMISHVQLVHFNLFPYSCKLCKCSFPRACMLKEHMMSIHEQPNYEVPVLPKNSLYDKTDDDKFYCSYCSTGFVHKIRLIEHMHKDHADAFPYKCDICVQGFLEKSFLVHHSLRVHGNLFPNDEAEKSKDAGQIMQVITTRSGCPSKIMQTVEVQNSEDIIEEGEIAERGDETLAATDTIQTSGSEATSLLVEVDNGDNTYRYVIEARNSIGQIGSESMVQNIANILIAAKQNTSETWNEQYVDNSASVQEVSVVINDNNQVLQETDNQDEEQPIEVAYGETNENINLVSSDTNQETPMEVVIDPNQENCITFAVENQAEPLNVAHGDIIELNDKSDGTNYYKIINVVENVDEIEHASST